MKGRILVVEDDLPTRQLLKLWFSGEGYEVEFTADEHSTMDFIEKWRPDAVLLDLLLPAPVGFDICRQAKRVSDVPVMVMTARTLDSDRDSAFEAGADDFVLKPFEWADLLGKVRSMLQRNTHHNCPAYATA